MSDDVFTIKDCGWNSTKFDPNPYAYSHMCHWGPWAVKYANEEGPIGTLARMLFAACGEITKGNKIGVRTKKAHAILLFAFIDLVETGAAKPLADEDVAIGGAWASIQTLNRWREENKLNIKLVDV